MLQKINFLLNRNFQKLVSNPYKACVIIRKFFVFGGKNATALENHLCWNICRQTRSKEVILGLPLNRLCLAWQIRAENVCLSTQPSEGLPKSSLCIKSKPKPGDELDLDS